jgi:DNA-binding MarR family transcriptional regulator
VSLSIPEQHEFLEPDEWRSWNAVLMLSRSALAELDAELRRSHGLQVTEFDVLITLYNAPDGRLSMSELAARSQLSPAGTTHLVTRLERDRLVRREAGETDRRQSFAVLTGQGDAALRAARRTHNEVLRRTFFGATSATERRTLQEIWARVTAGAIGSDG